MFKLLQWIFAFACAGLNRKRHRHPDNKQKGWEH